MNKNQWNIALNFAKQNRASIRKNVCLNSSWINFEFILLKDVFSKTV